MDIETSQHREMADLPDDDPPKRGKPMDTPDTTTRARTVPRGGEAPRDTTAESRTGDEDYPPRDPADDQPPDRGQQAHQGDATLSHEPVED